MLHKNTDTADSAGEGARFSAARLLGLRVQIPLGAWLFVSCIRIRCVCVCIFLILCDLETPTMTWPRLELGCCVAEDEEKRKLQKK